MKILSFLLFPLILFASVDRAIAQHSNIECYTIFVSADGKDSTIKQGTFSGELLSRITYFDGLFSYEDTLQTQPDSSEYYKIICSTTKLAKRSAHGSFEYIPLGGAETFCITDSTKGSYITIPNSSYQKIMSDGFMTPIVLYDTLVKKANHGIFLKIEYSWSSSFCNETMAIPLCSYETRITTIYCIREDEYEDFLERNVSTNN